MVVYCLILGHSRYTHRKKPYSSNLCGYIKYLLRSNVVIRRATRYAICPKHEKVVGIGTCTLIIMG